MSINHHIDDASVLSFAAGSLPPAFAVVYSSHIGMCSHCRQKVRQAESIGGTLLASEEAIPLSDGALNNLLEKLDATSRTASAQGNPPTDETVKDDKVLPPQVASLVDRPVSELKWRRAGSGVAIHKIDLGADQSANLFLMKIAAGKVLPEHGHGAHEATLVLSGAYTDKCGRFARGDIADLDAEVEHQPVVDPDAQCICLVAVDAPTRFKGLVQRMLQPLVGI